MTADVEANELGDYFVGERTRVYVRTGARKTFLIPSVYIRRLSGVDRVKLEDGREVVVQTGPVLGDETEILSGVREQDRLVMP